MPSSESFYRQMSGEGATYIGLLLVVYDTLAEDLRRAGQAVARADIQARCDATNHAFLLLGHLESWVASLDDATLQTSLLQFYSYLRSQATHLQTASQPDGFFELAKLVGETRAAWQKRESQQARAGHLPSVSAAPQPWPDDDGAGARQSWSA